jgi:hypothetical protein
MTYVNENFQFFAIGRDIDVVNFLRKTNAGLMSKSAPMRSAIALQSPYLLKSGASLDACG